jgi:hypothetical protein
MTRCRRGLPQRKQKVCNAQIFLDSMLKQVGNSQIGHFSSSRSRVCFMRHPMAAPTSSLPSLMMPCPVCAGRMAYSGRRLIAPDVEDTIYGCRRCGAELIRTSVHQPSAQKPAAA